MWMTFYEKNKILSCDNPIKTLDSNYYRKPSVGEKVVLDGIMYTVCEVVINYDECQILIVVDIV